MNTIPGSRVLITGGAGFVGSAIARQLLAAGAAQVRVLDNFIRGSWVNLSEALETGRVEVIEGDIRDVQTVARCTEGMDYVFHEAALRITRCAEAPREAVDVLIVGTLNVLEAAVQNRVKKMVAASSASVYGQASYQPMDEGHPFNNRTLYGAGKIANEQMLRAFSETYKLPYVALRYFNVYGPGMDLEGVYTEVLIRWLDAIDAGKAPAIFGDGSQTMDFVDVEDVARANLLALQSDVTDEVFNVGTGIQTSLLNLCRLVLRLTGSSAQPVFGPERKFTSVRERRAGIALAESKLGFRAQIPLEEGLKRLIAWRGKIKSSQVGARP